MDPYACHCGKLMVKVTTTQPTPNPVTLPIRVPRSEANDCRKNSKRRLFRDLKIARKDKMEASVCRKSYLEATACRKYKFSLKTIGTSLDIGPRAREAVWHHLSALQSRSDCRRFLEITPTHLRDWR